MIRVSNQVYYALIKFTMAAAEGANMRRVAAAMMRDFQGTIVEEGVAKVGCRV